MYLFKRKAYLNSWHLATPSLWSLVTNARFNICGVEKKTTLGGWTTSGQIFRRLWL